jgi:hypothetical protein
MNYLSILIFSILLVSSLPGPQEITGPMTPEDIFQKCPGWQAVAAAYAPAPEAVDRLRGVSREVLVEVVLGTWCSDSKAHVSEFLKVLELADNPLIRAEYIAVPEDKAKRSPDLQDKGIVKIPTFIIYVDGVEKGRIVEVPLKTVEDDLAGLIEN